MGVLTFLLPNHRSYFLNCVGIQLRGDSSFLDEPELQGPVHDADAGHGQTYVSKVIIRLAGQGSHIEETALLLG